MNRRNIRVKVFQSIYESQLQTETGQLELALRSLDQKIQETGSLLLASVHLLHLLSQYVLIYANQKASKHLATAEDRNVNIQLSRNVIITRLASNKSLTDELKKHKLSHLFEEEFIRTLFLKLIESREYQEYIQIQTPTEENDRTLVNYIVKALIFGDELSVTFLSEHFQCWYNDEEMVVSWFEKILQSPATFRFNKLLSAEKLEFSRDLIKVYFDKKEDVFQLIEPKLVNWDAERVAIIDRILLHLGICELLYFPTIPVKVTINEYIDLAKQYSTLQSGNFVNGLLDNVHKELVQEKKLYKENYIRK
ncbi:MAG TPA: transcription antitermination factor NusB [Chitinophagaceae bacterium]|nr:transcription antitermination factor NusB [Chitinophagaceae bacterium]